MKDVINQWCKNECKKTQKWFLWKFKTFATLVLGYIRQSAGSYLCGKKLQINQQIQIESKKHPPIQHPIKHDMEYIEIFFYPSFL